MFIHFNAFREWFVEMILQWPIISNYNYCINLGGGFKYLLFSPPFFFGRFPIWRIFFKGVGSTTNQPEPARNDFLSPLLVKFNIWKGHLRRSLWKPRRRRFFYPKKKTPDVGWKNLRKVPGWRRGDTVDGRNPANQLRLVVYPTIYKVFAPSQVVQEFSHQQ